MTLSNPLTVAIESLQALFWAALIGTLAIRALGYTPHSVPVAISLGAIGLLLGHYAFPRGIWDLPWWSFPFELTPIPGFCWALMFTGGRRALEWWMERQDRLAYPEDHA